MGSFSFLKADNLTKVANIVVDKPFKFLIPAQFGGGFIKDYYQDYGELGTRANPAGYDEPMYDMYEVLAFWNPDALLADGSKVRDKLEYDGAYPTGLKTIDQHTMLNRRLGIELTSTRNPYRDSVQYPLKLVSASYKGAYEECDGVSTSDPNQGWTPLYRESRLAAQATQPAEKKTCVSLKCPFIPFCKSYNFLVDRGEKCEVQTDILNVAKVLLQKS